MNESVTDKAQRGITRKLRILNHAQEINNSSKTCRYFGISRETFLSLATRLPTTRRKGLEASREDYGQAVIYRGTAPKAFLLDGHHRMETGKVFPACGNTLRMLQETRFAPHFDSIGDFSTHYGIFEGCGIPLPFGEDNSFETSGGCC